MSAPCRQKVGRRNVSRPIVFSLYCRPIVVVDEMSVDELSRHQRVSTRPQCRKFACLDNSGPMHREPYHHNMSTYHPSVVRIVGLAPDPRAQWYKVFCGRNLQMFMLR